MDKRESILSRLETIFGAITKYEPRYGAGVVSVWRNRGELKSDKRPAIVLLDGNESIKTTLPVPGRQRGLAPVVLSLAPEVYYLAVFRTPNNEEIGPELNEMKGKILRALHGDSTLLNMLGDNGGIVYGGVDTDLRSGNRVEGEMRVFLTLNYVLNPKEL